MVGIMKNRTHLFLCIAMMSFLGQAFAAADPTQPPAAWGGGSTDTAVADEAGVLRLQSVLIRQRGRSVAVIGGVTVPLGGSFGEAKLIRLSEREAVLEGPDGVTHLYLTPNVEKQMIVTPGARKTQKAGQGKDSR
jgi:MSHA biogenesis protein MshK